MTTSNGFHLAASLYALTLEWHSHRYSLDEMLAKVAALGLGPGLEVEAFQTIRGFPYVSDEFADSFLHAVDRYGLEPVCLGGKLDLARRADRLMTVDEQVVYLEEQLVAARKLGFIVLRVGADASPAALERLVPACERNGVKLGIEIHSPETATTPKVNALRELFDRLGSPYLGFIPDFGSTMTDIPPGFIRSLRRDGVPAELTDVLLAIWRDDTDIAEKRPQFVREATSLGADAATISKMMVGLALFGKGTPRSWLEIMPHIVHIHGKFYEFDGAGNAVAVPYPELIAALKEGGYDGFMSLEWEGHIWMDDLDGFAAVKMQHDLCERLIAL
jgi:sugar phosphate isomerase/epimerase